MKGFHTTSVFLGNRKRDSDGRLLVKERVCDSLCRMS